MTIHVDIDLGYEFSVKASYDKVFALLADVPTSAGFFPEVDKLVPLGANSFRWEMKKLGNAQVGIQTVYACKYKADARKGSIVWTPVKGVGNAQIRGSWKITAGKKKTTIVLETAGVVDVALPELMSVVVGPVVNAEFERVVETYIDNLIVEFGGEVD